MKKNILLAIFVMAGGALASLQGCGGDGGNTGGGGGTSSSSSSSSSTSTSSSSSSSSSTSSSSSSSTSTSSSSSSSSSGSMNPPPPTLGAQIDRFGRPAINTALNHTFDVDAAAKGAAKDAYNADGTPANWVTANAAEFAKNLAILDSLDTVCGNQLLAGPTATAGRYNTLAGALAGDVLYVNTAGATCTTYLAVEANATGILTNTDCGGRKLDYDPIDASYSALAAGMLSGVGDGVSADADTKGTTFPYLAAPH